ncbi:MAG: DUF1501 domain-containing protein [Bryobacteraceae bacterium]
MKSRREFLKRCCTFGACGAAAHLTRFGLMTANAQSTSTYKALVCIFMNGGNDSNNMIVPLNASATPGNPATYSAYQAARGSLALGQGAVLPVTAGGVGYGLHPNLVNIRNLYQANKAAMILNVGTLVGPMTKATLNSSPYPMPRNLYSHSDQTQQWQTANPTVAGGTGWGGRMTDVIAAATPFPAGVSVSGNSALLTGAQTGGVTIAPGSNFGLNSFGNATAMNARFAALQQILTFDTGVQLISAGGGVLKKALDSAQEINAALTGGTPLATVFPNSGLGQQLAQVARIMQVRGALGMDRQIFFASIGGFDTHSNLINDQGGLMATIDGAVGAFQTALAELGIEQNVITFTESEFNRTMNSNGTNGSDHAWGGHHFVIGGPVKGANAYGTFPNPALNGPDDVGNRGLWLPTTSLDQYAATMASWFGVPDAALTGAPGAVFPNLVNFPVGVRKMTFI